MAAPTNPSQKPPSYAFVVSVASIAFVVSQLDVSIVNIALPQIARAFDAPIPALQWIVDAYTIAFAAFMLSAGGMGDLYGSKKVFQIGMMIFCIASAGCGFSWDVLSLTLFRILQGIGSAVMIPNSLSVIGQAFSHDQKLRGRAVALWTALGGVSIAAGPVIGAFLMHVSNWRMIFYVNVPICLLGLLLSFRLPESERHPHKKLDLFGQLLWMIILTILISVIIEWNELGAGHPLIYGGLLFSVLLFGGFLWFEKNTDSPILPLGLFRYPAFNVLLLLGVVANFAYYGCIFILSLYMQDILHYPVMQAGLAFLPLTGGLIISNLLSGQIMGRYGTRLPIIAGAWIASAGYAALLIVGPDTPYWQLFFPFLIIPMGMGLAIPAVTTRILGTVDKTLSGTASAILNTSRQAFGAIGVAIVGAMAAGDAAQLVNAVSLYGIFSAVALVFAAIFLHRYLRE
ncbi:MAG: MFS transporter [Mucilaginibacter polytrichastri]|nr:MFS transporter [Mucilaginibacter polytrichastri]